MESEIMCSYLLSNKIEVMINCFKFYEFFVR